MATRRKVSPILETAGGKPLGGRYASHPAWLGTRRWEAAETTRLNQAHWQWAQDEPINVWLASQLPVLRARSTYESKQNGMVMGMIATHADDIVGPDGPALQVQSSEDAFNKASEDVWREWFYAPTTRPNVSGAAWIKTRIKALWKQGAFLDLMVTDPSAEGRVAMRLRSVNTRRLATPAGQAGNPNVCMGVEVDQLGRPIRYWIADQVGLGQQSISLSYTPWPADMVLHEFMLEEEDQVAGVPWLTPGLQPAADLRDYDDQVQDATRQMADQASILYTEHPDAVLWPTSETALVQRRQHQMAPPGWKPAVYPATQPPVQYPDYRAERQRELGRAVGMPLLMIRLDASKHNYSSARLDTQVYRRAVAGLQSWLSGTDRSYGTLNRLHEEIIKEARFSTPALRRRPPDVRRVWTWPAMPHVDPVKEATAEQISLQSRTLSYTDAVAARGKDLESHVEQLKGEQRLLEKAALPVPGWMREATAADGAQEAAKQDDTIEDKVTDAQQK